MSARSTFSWSVRRELWEYGSIYIAPLIVAGLATLAFLYKLDAIVEVARALPAPDPGKQRIAPAVPFSIAASAVLFTSFVVALFYCLDALYGERRDRSILFWKSMPVSDRTTVLSKLFVALVAAPLVAFTIAAAMQLLLLAVSAVALLVVGVEVSALWSRVPVFQMIVVMLYGVFVHALWLAPVYGWLLLVSAWARSAPFLWAVAPVFAAFVVEKIAFGTSHVFNLARYRAVGDLGEAFVQGSTQPPIVLFAQLDPARFVSNAGLWTGLAFCVAFVAAAIRMRRNREPI